MSGVSLSLPIISDNNVVLSDQETRDVFAFFWPQRKSAIENMPVNINVRRYAQALLIVAIDASYLIGFIEKLVDVILRRKPGASIQVLVRKLTQKYVKHCWKHATQANLSDAKVYDTVRQVIALKQKSRFEMMLAGIAAIPSVLPSFDVPALTAGNIVWV